MIKIIFFSTFCVYKLIYFIDKLIFILYIKIFLLKILNFIKKKLNNQIFNIKLDIYFQYFYKKLNFNISILLIIF